MISKPFDPVCYLSMLIKDLEIRHQIQINQINSKLSKKSTSDPFLKWLKLSWILLCTFTCIYQMVKITDLYLSCQMNIETLRLNEQEVTPPAMVICMGHAFKKPCRRHECLKYLKTSRIMF